MKWVKPILIFAALWVLVAGAIVAQGLPWLPGTRTQWLLVVGLGPPMYLLAEGVFSWLFSARRGHRVSRRNFSLVRVLLLLLAVLVCFGLAWAAASWLDSALEGPTRETSLVIMGSQEGRRHGYDTPDELDEPRGFVRDLDVLALRGLCPSLPPSMRESA